MVPRTIKRGLARLRWRERWLRLSWGSVRWLALAVAALVLCCLADWVIDRFTETPWPLRALMLMAQAALWAGAAFLLVLWPVLRRLSDSRLALWVEQSEPRLGHRLISTVQFHQPGAKIAGMSPELIGAVTHETERFVEHVNFPAVADHRRLTWTAALGLPVALVIAVPLLLFPDTTRALLARQLLADVEIPRSIYLAPATVEVWPSGEEVVLRFRVWGHGLASDVRGLAFIEPDYGPTESYELVYDSMSKPGEAIFTARVRPLSVDFRYTAELADGRTRHAGRIRFVPRPAVVRQHAWLILPDYCGKRSDGSRYEVEQPRGEIVGLRGLPARVEVAFQKPVRSAVLEILGTPYPDLSQPTGQSAAQRVAVETATAAAVLGRLGAPGGLAAFEAGAGLLAGRGEIVLERLDQEFEEGAREVRWTIPRLEPTFTGYRIKGRDEYHFDSLPAPPRGIAVVPERPPQVALLRERFQPPEGLDIEGPDEDFEVDGMPVAFDKDGKPGPIRIAYSASGPFGLGRARLRFRVLRKVEGSQQETPEGEEHWYTYQMQEKPGTGRDPFDLTRGVFADSDDEEEVPFHAFTPERAPLPRTLGGGRFEFHTSNLLDNKGQKIELRPGDQLEFYVEVLNRNPDGLEAVAGRSETRVKTLVSGDDFVRWVLETLQEESRLRQLDARQRGVMSGKRD
jgi:hypothetical protein